MRSSRGILVLALVALLVFAGAAATAARRVDTRMRVGKSIGAARLGMTVSQVRRALHTRPTRAVTRDNPQGEYRIRRVGRLFVLYDPQTMRAAEVSTRSRRFHYRALHPGSSRRTVLRRLAGKGWRHLNCPGTAFEIVYYPDEPFDDPTSDGKIPTAKALISLAGRKKASQMTVSARQPLFRSPQCTNRGL